MNIRINNRRMAEQYAWMVWKGLFTLLFVIDKGWRKEDQNEQEERRTADRKYD